MDRQLPKLVQEKCNRVVTGRNYRTFEKSELEDLVGSIKRRGILQPLILTTNNNKKTIKNKPYELVAGERRFRCCEILNKTFPAMVYENLTQEDFLAIQLAENVKRHINPGELAENAFEFYKELLAEKIGMDPAQFKEYTPKNLPAEYRRKLSIPAFSMIIGRGESTVKDYFSFVSLDKKVRKLVLAGKYDFVKATLLSRLPQNQQLALAVNFKGTTSELERLIKSRADTEKDFSLTSTETKAVPNLELANYLRSTRRVIRAGSEYFKSSKQDYPPGLKPALTEALKIVGGFKMEFERVAKAEGKLEGWLAQTKGKKAHREYVLGTNFDLTGKLAKDVSGELKYVCVDLLEEDKEQPRQTYDSCGIEELKQSIKEIGQREPCIITPIENGKYIVVDGNRRRRALVKYNQERAKDNLPPEQALCIITNMSRLERRICQYEAELHQEDRPDERAEAIKKWADFQSINNGKKLSSADIATRMGIGKTTVRSALDYAEASEQLKRLYQHGLITYGAAAELSKVEESIQQELGFKVYLRGGNISVARKAREQFVREQSTASFDFINGTNAGFGNALCTELNQYLHPRALDQLKKGDIYSPSFISSFYSLYGELQKLNYSIAKRKCLKVKQNK